ncbi:ATP-binding cassette domain-containing protein [Actinomadura sp. DC4]|uniref:ATP-binding cassette domain-containing protein n=1 Tax=Actinomadura sp. DC4 TaxID=3055069 RepID=UPI0025AF33E1|nr:ATP-binding cassette domain-containing protein [Actinomadura sp. DC4]MDN3357036.1 ATP-binding cassette domain-containing protein [Actinomadura sp. DC4]
MNTTNAVIAEPPAPLPLPPGPYELRVSGLRTRRPDGEMLVLGDVDLPPGRRVALLGHSRATASALAAVLLRFADYEGTVTLNDVPLRELAGEDVRRVIARVGPDTPILPTGVAGNVRVARPDATDEELAGAMRRAGLTPGDSASGAARPRVALARALLADVPILLADEPEEGLAALLAAEDRSLLLVTHRAAVPGATPILRHVDEVISLSVR